MLDTFQQMISKELWILISQKQVLKTPLIGQIHLQNRCLITFGINSGISVHIASARVVFYGGISIALIHISMLVSGTLRASQCIQPSLSRPSHIEDAF
jgi:hypothetical protein